MSGMMLAFAGGSYGAAPVNTVTPVVSGTATVGQTLSTTNGTWTGSPSPSFTYQWQRTSVNIASATSSTYVLVAADVANTIRCVVKATNTLAPAGVTANSNSTASVAASVPDAPTIGTATQTGATTATVAYTAPASNGGATITSYTATSSPGSITGTLSQAGSGTITVSGLTTSTSYTFTVTATNSVGTSAPSAASNSVTPTAVGFLATEVYSGIYNKSRNVAVNSSGTIYKLPEGNVSLIQYSSTGTQNWNRYGYTGQSTYVNAVDSSDNYYIGGQFTSFNGQISKYNSSDTLQWSTSFSSASGSEAIIAMTRPVIDSSGNVYVGYRGRTDAGCCIYNYKYYMTKFNSSGTIQNAQSLSFEADGVDYGQTVGIGVDSSGNIYNMLGAIWSGYGAVALYKHDSSGTRLASKFIIKSPSGSVDAFDYLFDTTNSVGYFVGDISDGGVAKHDTSLAITWAYDFTSISSLHGVALDSSGNVYAVGMEYISGTNGPLRIIKLNSSGTLQWARTLSLSGYRVDNTSNAPKISINGSKFVIAATTTDSASITRAFTFQAPTDGSGTGTISNASLSWVYSSLTTSGTSKALSVNNNGSTSAATRTPTSRTPTIAASSWVSTVTSY